MYIVFFPGHPMGERFDDIAVMARRIEQYLRENRLYKMEEIRIASYA